MKEAGIFVLKSVVFATIFWALWLFAFKPINAYVAASSEAASQTSSTDSQDKLMEKYWEQARQAERIQNKYMEQAKLTDEHQKRFEAQLKKQEEVFQRFDQLVRKWETQSSPRK